MNKGTFKINPYKTITIIWDEELPNSKELDEIFYKVKHLPLLSPTEAEAAIISGLLLAFKQSVKEYLQLDLPDYTGHVHVVDVESIKAKSVGGVANRGIMINFMAYASRQDSLGSFAIIASHEIAHLFAKSLILWKVVERRAKIYHLSDGVFSKNRFKGLNEVITEKLAHYTKKYALANNLINLGPEEVADSKELSHSEGVNLVDGLLDRHANGDTEMRQQYVKDLFRAYLQGDTEKALEALGIVSDDEREVIKNMGTEKQDFLEARAFFNL